jgi:hypothetical protein
MYKYQNGCLPNIFSIIGAMILTISLIGAVLSTAVFIKSAITLKDIIQPLLLIILFTMACFFSFLFGGFFPALQITEEGINIKYIFGLLKVKILWSEIIEFVPHHIFRKIMIIAFKREGYSILKPKTLIFNAIYGLWAGAFLPVLLLYKTSDFDDLYLEINKKINSF